MASGIKKITELEETKDIPDSKLLETDKYTKELIELAGLKLPEFTDDDFDSLEYDESIPEKMKKINDFISERFGDILSSDDKEEIIDFVKKTIDCEDEEDDDDDRNIYSENEKINKILKQERKDFKSFKFIREFTRGWLDVWPDFRFVSLKSYQNKDKNVYHLCYDGCYYCYYVCYVGRKGNFYRAYMFRVSHTGGCVLPIVNNKNILDYCDIKEEILKNRE